MKKILGLAMKGICVMLPMILIWAYTWMNPLGFMTDGTPFDLWNKEKTNTKQEKYYEAVFLGDSTANAAYVPEVLSDASINLSLGSITPMEAYYILQDWIEHNEAPKTCYISFLDYHMKDTGTFWIRTMYTHRFRMDQNLEMLKEILKYGEGTSIETDHYVTDFIAYELRLPNKYITSLMNAGFNQRYEENIKARALSALHGGRYIARGTQEYETSKTIKFKNFEVHPLFDRYYRRLIELCMEHDIQVRLVKLPLPENEKFTENYKEEFGKYYDRLKEDYPDITVDWIPTYKQEYFADRNHVNSHGALQFSREMKARYPEDFTAELTPSQIEALNDSIADENQPEQIIQWASGKDYTLLFQDTSGKFASVYGELLKSNSYTAKEIRLETTNVYCAAASDSGGEREILVQEEKDKILIKQNDQDIRTWEKGSDGLLKVMVIDNYNNKIVCEKSFEYRGETFSLIQ
ncbi:hypothetical protein FMM74_000240 [Lachnospiraceae bacterium MD308]|nr:hypothetical protein [Lachnospiraceae bacterium MD308]